MKARAPQLLALALAGVAFGLAPRARAAEPEAERPPKAEPAASEPVAGPAASEPVAAPAASEPVAGPAVNKPVAGPAASQPNESVAGPRAIELEAAFGSTLFLGQPAYPDQQQSFSQWGIMGRLAISYRTRYPVLPYFAIEHARLASGATTFEDQTIGQRLSSTSFLPGAFFELEPVRFKVALGMSTSTVTLSEAGESHGSGQLNFSAEIGAAVTLVRTRFFTTNLDLHYLAAGGADLHYLSLSLGLRGDIWSNTTRSF